MPTNQPPAKWIPTFVSKYATTFNHPVKGKCNVEAQLIEQLQSEAVEKFKKDNSFEYDEQRKEHIEELVHRATRTKEMGGYHFKTIAQWIDDIIFMTLINYRNDYEKIKNELQEEARADERKKIAKKLKALLDEDLKRDRMNVYKCRALFHRYVEELEQPVESSTNETKERKDDCSKNCK